MSDGVLDSVSRFDRTVDSYVKYRPSYPGSLLNFLSEQCGSSPPIICELGAGTGIFTRQIANARIGREIYAIEPNDKMRSAAEAERLISEACPVHYIKATAEHTDLPSDSVSCVIGAQCFHWFDLEQTIAEINRITLPGSFCCAIWNDRVETGFTAELEILLRAMSRPYLTLRRPDTTISELKTRLPDGKEISFGYGQKLSLEGLIGRMASTSYVAHGVDDKEAFNKSLTDLFELYQASDMVEIVYKTRVFYWYSENR